MSSRPTINQYTCAKCGGKITTIDRAEGVTPMYLNCRATQGCNGRMGSAMYRVDQSLTPTHEFYRPNEREMRTVEHIMLDHVRRGGLLLRKVATGNGNPVA